MTGGWTRLLACLAAASVAASCGPDDSLNASPPSSTGQFNMGDVESEYSGSGPSVVVLGDSIADLSRRELHHVLDPYYRTKIAAVWGEGFASGPLSAAIADGKAVMLEAAAEYARDAPATVVIALGTNDAWSPRLELDAAEDAMAQMVAEFPDSCIVGVEINEWSKAENYDRGEAAALNERLRALADVVVPALQPSDVADDMIHPKAEGRMVLARAIASGVRQCR